MVLAKDSFQIRNKTCCCDAPMSDEECHNKYPFLRAELPESNWFSCRHRSCGVLVATRIFFDLLLICRQMHAEAAPVVFNGNTFTLAGPLSFAKWLEVVTQDQVRAIRSLVVYQTNTQELWSATIDRVMMEPLVGLRRVSIFIELCLQDMEPTRAGKESLRSSEAQDMRLKGISAFGASSVKEIRIMITRCTYLTTPSTFDGWAGRIKQMVLPSEGAMDRDGEVAEQGK